MKMFYLKPYLCFLFLMISAAGISQTTDVLQQHNDDARTGWNPKETILNTSNVTPTNFGILYKITVDDQIFAQPLIVTGVNVTDPITHTQVARNLLIVVTVNNTMYAFDADDGTLDPYWKRNVTPAGKIPPYNVDIHVGGCSPYQDFKNNVFYNQKGSFGTVGTPVIDKATNSIYFVSRYRDLNVDNSSYPNQFDYPSTGFYQQVNALDLSTGADKFGSPALIDPVTTYVLGVGADRDVNNQIHFDPRRENQRAGLFISNGIVYIPYAAHCDMDYYHGWILGYQLGDLSQQLIRYNTSPNNTRGGIWMAGAAPAVDAQGNFYFAVGNGDFGSVASSPQDMSMSVVKAAPDLVNHTLTNVSWYKPTSSTYDTWNQADLDFGTGVVLVPGSNMLVTEHKSGKLFIGPQSIPAPGGSYNETNTDVHWIDLAGQAQCHGSLGYFGGANRQFIYQFSERTHLTAYPVNAAANNLGSPVINTSVVVNGGLEGGYFSISSNGTDPTSAILWVSHQNGISGGIAHAVKADDITQELWNSENDPADKLGDYAKMCPPTIANGKVYIANFNNSLNIYGLLANSNRCVTNIARNKTYGDLPTTQQTAGFTASQAFDGDYNSRWSMAGVTPEYLFVDLGSRYDICKIKIQWNNGVGGFPDYAKSFTVDISDDGIAWTTINTITANQFTTNPAINEFNEHSTARFVRIFIPSGGQGQAGTSVSEFEVYGSPANNCLSPAAGSMNVTNISNNSASLNFTSVAGITNYIVKYRPSTIFSYVTKNIQNPSGLANPISLNIIGLTCGQTYDFSVQSDCGSGQLGTPSLSTFTTGICSNPCFNVTKWASTDLGDVQVAGNTCYAVVNGTDEQWTISGAGTGLAGTGDVFQFNYTDLPTDGEILAQITSQDATPASNQAGVIIRDSLTDISRFIFIGKTGNNQLVMMYRSTPGGVLNTLFLPNPGNANYFRIVKVGTSYTAYYGTSDIGPWNAMGPAGINLNFGTNSVKKGMAVSSTNPSVASTAVFLISNSGNTLPAEIFNLKAENISNLYIAVKWQTTQEMQNDHFVVEHSVNGTEFNPIGTVKSQGNSSSTQNYFYKDDGPAAGVNFYRLKQVDTDGRFNYSPVVQVKFGKGVEPVIYPNPVESVFTAVSGAELIREIVIYNVQGKAVMFATGNSTDVDMKVNIMPLAKGTYFLKVKTDSKVYQVKIIKN